MTRIREERRLYNNGMSSLKFKLNFLTCNTSVLLQTKKTDNLIHRLSFYVILYRIYNLLKTSLVFWVTLYMKRKLSAQKLHLLTVIYVTAITACMQVSDYKNISNTHTLAAWLALLQIFQYVFVDSVISCHTIQT